MHRKENSQNVLAECHLNYKCFFFFFGGMVGYFPPCSVNRVHDQFYSSGTQDSFRKLNMMSVHDEGLEQNRNAFKGRILQWQPEKGKKETRL